MTIESVTGDGLIARIAELQSIVREYKFPELQIETVTDDGETYEALRCPRCGNLATEDDLYAVDTTDRWNGCGDIDVDNRDISFSSDGSGEFGETLYYLHNEHAVSLPDGYRESWH